VSSAALACVVVLLGAGCPAHLQPPAHYDPALLREEEGRAALELAVLEEERETRVTDPGSCDPCGGPSTTDRLQLDGNFIRAADDLAPAIDVRIDALLPALEFPGDEACPAESLPAVGFELLTDEAGDDEDHSGDPYGLTDAEERGLQALREHGTALITLLDPRDFPVTVHFRDTGDDDGPSMEEREVEDAQRRLREAVRAVLATLRREGLL
jgi:hypothetical protein